MRTKITLLAVLSVLACYRAESQTAGTENCYTFFLSKGLVADTVSADYKAALYYFEAAGACLDMPEKESLRLDSLIKVEENNIDKQNVEFKLQAKIAELTNKALDNADANPTLALQLANEASRFTKNKNELAVGIRRKLLEKKDAKYYSVSIDCKCKILALSASPDDRYIAVSCQSDPFKLYDRSKGDWVDLAEDYTSSGYVNAIVFSSNSDKLLTGDSNGELVLWNLAGDTLATLNLGEPISDAAISPEGDVVVAALNSSVVVAKIDSGFHIRQIISIPNEAMPNCVAFAPDGHHVLVGLRTFQVLLIDLRNNAIVEYPGHTQSVICAAFSQDGDYFITGATDNTAKIWDLKRRKVIRTLKGHDNHVRQVGFFKNSDLVFTASTDRSLKIWNRNGDCVATMHWDNDIFGRSAAIIAKDSLIVTGDYEGNLRFWPLENSQLFENLPHHKGIVSVANGPGDSLIVTGGLDKMLKIWNLKTGKVVWTYKASDQVIAVDWSADGQHIIAGLWNSIFLLFDRNGLLLHNWEGQHNSSVRSLAFSPDGSKFITGSYDNTAKIWTLEGNLVNTISHKGYVSTVDWSSDGKTVITGSWDATVQISPYNGRLTKTLRFPGAVNCVRFSRDGRKFLVCYGQGPLQVFSAAGDSLFSLPYNAGYGDFYTADFSFTGDTIITGTSLGIIQSWANGSSLLTYSGHLGYIYDIRRLGNTARMVSAGADGRARLWNMKKLSVIKTLRGHLGSITQGLPLRTGKEKKVATLDDDFQLNVWQLPDSIIHTIRYKADTYDKSDSITAFDIVQPGERYFIVGCRDGKLGRIGPYTRDTVTLDRFAGSVISVHFSANEQKLLAADDRGNMRIYRKNNDFSLEKVYEHNFGLPITAARFSQTGQYALLSVKDSNYTFYDYLWDCTGDSAVSRIKEIWEIQSIAFSNNEDRFASGGSWSGVRIWDTRTRKPIKTLSGSTFEQKIVFSPDDRYLLTIDGSGRASLWDATAEKKAVYCLQQFSLDDDEIVNAAFLSSDSIVVFGKRTGPVLIHNQISEIARGKVIPRISADQRKKFDIEYDGEECLLSSNMEEIRDCADYFYNRCLEQPEDNNLFATTDSLYRKLTKINPTVDDWLDYASLFSTRSDHFVQSQNYKEASIYSLSQVELTKKAYDLEPLSERTRTKLYNAYWNYSWYVILSGDFRAGLEAADAGLAVPSENEEKNGIISNKAIAMLLSGKTEQDYQKAKAFYTENLERAWVDNRFPTFREVFEDDFKEIEKTLKLSPENARKVSLIRKDVLKLNEAKKEGD